MEWRLVFAFVCPVSLASCVYFRRPAQRQAYLHRKTAKHRACPSSRLSRGKSPETPTRWQAKCSKNKLRKRKSSLQRRGKKPNKYVDWFNASRVIWFYSSANTFNTNCCNTSESNFCGMKPSGGRRFSIDCTENSNHPPHPFASWAHRRNLVHESDTKLLMQIVCVAVHTALRMEIENYKKYGKAERTDDILFE